MENENNKMEVKNETLHPEVMSVKTRLQKSTSQQVLGGS